LFAGPPETNQNPREKLPSSLLPSPTPSTQEFSLPLLSKETLQLPTEAPQSSTEAPQLSTLGKIRVNKFKFEGNTVFTEAELLKVIPEDYKTREISAEELQEIKNKLTQYYVDKGYINSGVVIPDQEVRDGEVTLKIVEGKLTDVQILRNDRLRPSYFQNRIVGGEGEVFDVNTLQDRLQMLQQNPLLRSIQAELGPGVRLGEALLKLGVVEETSEQIQLTFNNHRSPSVGANRLEVELWERNLTGWLGKGMGFGDTLYLRYGVTGLDDEIGLKDGGIRYDFPLNLSLNLPLNHLWNFLSPRSWNLPLTSYETTFSLLGERSDSDVVEPPFNQINVASKADTYSLTVKQPLYKTLSQELNLALTLEKRTSKTYLLGRLFSFSPGVDDGQSHISAIRFSQDWVRRTTYDVLAIRSVLNFGIDVGDATINDDGSPDGKFFTWLGQFQWVRRLDFLHLGKTPEWKKAWEDGQIIFRTDFQESWDPLLPLEKLSIGGAGTVRGYRENLLTHDNGIITSLEVRIPLPIFPILGQPWKIQLPWGNKTPEDGAVQLALFADYGHAEDERETIGPKDISSVGAGLRWTPSPKAHAEVYYGKAFQDVEAPEEKDWQDNGWHFEVVGQYQF
jgi:hemolysin activation/secretion protein